MSGNEHGQEALIAVAHAVKTRGLKGEIVADLLTDFPDRFAGISRLICITAEGTKREVELENYWLQHGRVILKLAGVDDIESAAAYVNSEFAVPESERVQLPAGQFYDWELQGCAVDTVEGRRIGQVKAVMRTGGVDTLVIENEEHRDYLVPLAEPIVIKVDIVGKAISIDPPEGLLEL